MDVQVQVLSEVRKYSPEVKRLRCRPVTAHGAGSTPVRTAKRPNGGMVDAIVSKTITNIGV